MGVGVYKGGAVKYHSVMQNLSKLIPKYEYINGYFGLPGSSNKIRHIYSDDPNKTAKDFYNKISYGGVEETLSNGKGKITNMSDGTIITWREISSSDGSPAIDINIKYSTNAGGLKQQKIHFLTNN